MALGQALGEIITADVLEGEIGPPLILTNRVDGDDVRVIETSNRARLDLKAPSGLGLGELFLQNDLEGNFAP